METKLSNRDGARLLSTILAGTGSMVESIKFIGKAEDSTYLIGAINYHCGNSMRVARELAVDRWGEVLVSKLDNIKPEGEVWDLKATLAEVRIIMENVNANVNAPVVLDWNSI